MIASVCVKDGNIRFYNEQDDLSSIGGIVCELGKPLLNFLCYESERFDEAISDIVLAFETPGAETGMHSPEFKAATGEMLTNLQTSETYVYCFMREFLSAVYGGQPPREAARRLSADFRSKRDFMASQVELLLNFREAAKGDDNFPVMELFYLLDEYNKEQIGEYVYLEKPLHSFYGCVKPPEIAELYEINSIDDLCRFEFVKMIEHNIFIKKCKNCGWFFIPNRRQDAEYCDRQFGDTNRKCSEIGAMLRYEKKVAENPVWEIYKRNYRRQNSRARAKKMTQAEFLRWSEEASQKRDECLAGEMPFDEYAAWLEQGRIRKVHAKKQQDGE
ncbi:MAG: DUF6076 domain-containing protein [Gracilibacteraceae bacterium]|jgi:hypothetical protein|nr:DUF6076 domain-containing protein [Gracilibacteraceae bacterium]